MSRHNLISGLIRKALFCFDSSNQTLVARFLCRRFVLMIAGTKYVILGKESPFINKRVWHEMGIAVSFHRTRRKTEPLMMKNRNKRPSLEAKRERVFDDIALNSSNPFLNSKHIPVVPQSLEHFIGESNKHEELLNFYTDKEICNVSVSMHVIISSIFQYENIYAIVKSWGSPLLARYILHVSN